MNKARESRPADNKAAEISSGDMASISAASDRITATALIAGVHVVVVETSAGRYRRRVYFNLPSAQRAADRATMAGQPAHIILCQLMPVIGGERV